MGDSPDRGTFLPFAEGMGVFERDLRDVLQGQTTFESEVSAIEGERIVG
jgi:hypothetical protein